MNVDTMVRQSGCSVVLDTNVLVSAGFNPLSHAARIVRAVRERRLQMVWCEETRREGERVLRRIPPLSWSALADLFDEKARYQGKLSPMAHAYVPDPADRVFAALAHETRATLITQDGHLLAHRAEADVPFYMAREFVRHVLRDDRETRACNDAPRPDVWRMG